MLSLYVRLSLLAEALAYVLIVHGLHRLYDWDYAGLAAGALGAALASRLLLVCVSTAIGHVARSPRTPEQRIGIAATVAMMLREWRAVLVTNFFCLPWESLAVRPDPQAVPSGRVPIILVHGYFSNRGFFRWLVRALEARGVGPIFTPDFVAAFATIERFAEDLHREIERIAATTAQAQVVLICHSMGGLAARAYLCAHGSARVRKLVTIASPHNGTVQARFGAGPSATQMRQGSRFLAGLSEQEDRRGPPCALTSVYSPHDNLVAPQDSARLAWARNIAIPGCGHIDILGSELLADIVVEELREAGVEAPGR